MTQSILQKDNISEKIDNMTKASKVKQLWKAEMVDMEKADITSSHVQLHMPNL